MNKYFCRGGKVKYLRSQVIRMNYEYYLFTASSWFSRSDRRLLASVVQNVIGSSPVLPVTFYQRHLPSTSSLSYTIYSCHLSSGQ